MDRLTFDGNFCDIAQCLEMRGGKHCPDGYCSQRRVWERLKEYEDAGLEPDEIIKMRGEVKTAYDECGIPYSAEYTGYEAKHITDLIMAEQDGRLVELPCKVGSNIYRLTGQGNIYFWQIVTAEIYEEEIVLKDDSDNDIFLGDIGKTVFLTREEAEASTEKEGGKDDVAD